MHPSKTIHSNAADRVKFPVANKPEVELPQPFNWQMLGWLRERQSLGLAGSFFVSHIVCE